MASAPLVSVVICTYNGEAYLRQQLESILRQTLMPSEIILSDDGSTDRTLEIARDILSTAKKQGVTLKILTRKKPLGPAGNFSSALARATHPLIALADQDDVWHPDKLDVLAGRLGKNPQALLVHSDAALVDSAGARIGSLAHSLHVTRAERRALDSGWALDALLRRNLVTGATCMIRAGLLRNALPVPEGWVHDEWLALIAALQNGLIFDSAELIDYRQHSANQIGARRLSVSHAGARLKESRGDFFARKNLRNQALRGLVAAPPQWLPTKAREALLGKLEHDDWRSHLPPRRRHRLAPVLRRMACGHYGRYARGYLDVIRDLSLRA
jgi:glycosyltransferase involved in cell wall biosynthesis